MNHLPFAAVFIVVLFDDVLCGKFHFTMSSDGKYKISVGSTVWFSSGPTWFRANGKVYSTADGSLKLTKVDKLTGLTDNIGLFESKIYEYRTAGGLGFEAMEVTYPEIPEFVIFGQKYLNDTRNTSTGDANEVVSGFPTFQLEDEDFLGYFCPGGYFACHPKFGKWNKKDLVFEEGYKQGPVAFYDSKMKDAIVMSHFSSFMAASYWYENTTGVFHVGLQGRSEMVPRNYDMWTIMYHSDKGVNQAFKEWGSIMQMFYQSENAKNAETDFTVNYLGYWTDNGAFYYYNTEPNKTYEDSLIDYWNYAQKEGIRYRYHEYDSWFYAKDKNDNGMLSWYPLPSVFPHTASFIHKTTELHVGAHQRYWSPQTPLAKQHGGPYDFDLSSKYALPLDAKLWEDVLGNSTLWGTRLLVQDWVGQMYDNVDLLRTNVTIGRIHLHHLAKAAKNNGMTVELCTPYPRHILTALELPAVTYTRASGDYQPGNEQWAIALNAMWFYALGQRPFKDNYWSTKDQQCPKYPGKSEPYSELQSVVASLSAGPVGIGDGVGKSNASLIMRCCNADGLILQPSRPVTPLDSYFLGKSFGPSYGVTDEVWTTHSEISMHFFGILFGANFTDGKSYKITPKMAGWTALMADNQKYKIFSRKNPAKVMPFSDSYPVQLSGCTKAEFCLYYVSPVLTANEKDVVLLGELDKWIPFSPKRIRQVEIYGELGVTVKGAIGETVTMYSYFDNSVKTLSCKLSQSGSVVMRITTGVCDYNDL